MRVNGEAYFLLNVGLDLFSLLLAERLMRIRAKPARLLFAALLGGVYALAAAFEGSLRLLVWALPMGLLLSLTAFGRAGLRAFPGLMAGSLFLSGGLGFGLRREWPKAGILLLIAAAGLVLSFLLARGRIAPAERLTILIAYRGRSAALPAFRDSGNTLFDPLTGLPVMVLPFQGVRSLLPEGTDPRELSTLPRGFRLIRVRTAAGEKTLMCFHPERVLLRSGKRACCVDAVAAVSAFPEKKALLPEALFEEHPFHQEAM